MKKKSFLTGRERELQEFAERYETAKAENAPFYMDADDLADLADWYAIRRKYEQAMEVTEHGLRLHPGNTALLVEQAYLYLDTQNREKAKAIAQTVTEECPEATILRASILLGEGKLEETELLLDTIEDKEDLANIVDVAYMYLDMGFPQKAEGWLARGKELYADDEAYLAVRGDCHFIQGKFEEAISCYDQLIDKNPYSAPYWFGLARCYFEQSMYDKAIDACDFAIIADEEFADAYLMKGHAFFQLDNDEEAAKWYREAEKLNATAPGFMHMFVGLNKVTKGEWADALANLELAIAEYNDNSIVSLSALYANAALCLHKMGKKRKAHQYCKKAHEQDSNDLEVYLIEGRIRLEEGDHERGMQQWQQLLNMAPYADTWHEIGMCCLEMGKLEFARQAFENVQKLEPDFEGINELLTSVYMVMGDKENFRKYNSICKHPFQLEKLEEIQKWLENNNQEDLAQMMKSIFKALK